MCTHTKIYVCVHIWDIKKYDRFVYEDLCTYLDVYTYEYIYMCIRLGYREKMCKQILMCTHIYTCIRVYIWDIESRYIQICIHIYTYVFIYIEWHVCASEWESERQERERERPGGAHWGLSTFSPRTRWQSRLDIYMWHHIYINIYVCTHLESFDIFATNSLVASSGFVDWTLHI